MSDGAFWKWVFRLIFFHCDIRLSSSRLSISGVTSSLTVRTITPPDLSGRMFWTCSLRRERSGPDPIFRLTPTLEESGIYTRNLPAREIWAVTRGPFVEIGSFEI